MRPMHNPQLKNNQDKIKIRFSVIFTKFLPLCKLKTYFKRHCHRDGSFMIFLYNLSLESKAIECVFLLIYQKMEK